ncbi:translation initiation factor IF-3 [candidate division WWE3 bacterium]|uniref:Translation initiation factor IF-3 n=1 Tax=candidate division WWE3 bacterium TaxID=2053526 RepID=A0A955RRU9_UNCKA|nr:translation initiation factor IF-3 [candidate division WWE3 bacterium]
MRRYRKPTYIANESIRDDTLRVIDPEGESLGVLTREAALLKANEYGLDLVLVTTKTDPPVARIIDLSKFKYMQQKKEAEQRKGRKTELKELQFKPNIDDHDLQVRINRARQFIKDGDKVKFTVKFFGRMKGSTDIGREKLETVKREISDFADVESEPSMERNFMTMYIKPK